jgi:uncharacterized membrane protein (DUF2068 family)
VKNQGGNLLQRCRFFHPAVSESQGRPNRLIRYIAVFKLFKAVLLTLLGIGAFRLLNPAVGRRLAHWVGSFAWEYNRGFILSALTKLVGLPKAQLRTLGIGAFLYAMLFATEGIGLWFEKRWAEYLTIVATGSLLPLEIYEVFRKPTYSHSIALLINLALFVYLIRVVRRRAAKPQ